MIKEASEDNWKWDCLKRLAEPLGGEDEAIDLDDPENEPWENAALLRVFQMVFPSVDLATLDNGISASLLGAFLGHQKAALNQMDSMWRSLSANFECIEMNVQKIGDKKEACLAKVESKDRESALQVFEQIAQVGPAFSELHEFMGELVELRPALEDAIAECLKIAADQPPADSVPFFEAFSKVIGSPTLDLQGHVVHKNPKTARIYVLLAGMGDSVKDLANSVPDLHRLLSKLVSDEILTSDEDSLEWLKDRKSIEGVCRNLGLSFRKSGRPRKRKIPNTK